MSKIIGYGKSPKGKVLHAIVDGGIARCDKNMSGLEIDKMLDAGMVTCSKCAQLKEVRDAVPSTAPTQKSDIGLTTASPKHKSKPKTKPKPKPKAKPKAKPEAKAKPVDEYDFVAQKSKGDVFSIYHRPSKRKFFENIPSNIIDGAVVNLNDMEMRWSDGKDKVPAGFINECRKALKLAYEQAGVEPPKGIADDTKSKPKRKAKKKVKAESKTEKFKKGDELELNGVVHVFNGKDWKPKKKTPSKPKRVIKRRKKPEAKKPKRVIKRRKKAEPKKKAEPEKSKRKIKRREKPETNEYGMMPGRPPYAIVEYIKGNGAQFNDIVEMLMDEYELSEKRAKNKVRRIVNKLARRLKVQIAIVMTEDEGSDHYMIM